MKTQLSNLRNVRRISPKHCFRSESWKRTYYVATVDITTTTGFLWFKKTKTETKDIARLLYWHEWFYTDTAELIGFDLSTKANDLLRMHQTLKDFNES